MDIQLIRKAPNCFSDNCPGDEYKVSGLPGWKVVVGRKPETLLDAEALAQLRGRVGPDEYASLVPDSE